MSASLGACVLGMKDAHAVPTLLESAGHVLEKALHSSQPLDRPRREDVDFVRQGDQDRPFVVVVLWPEVRIRLAVIVSTPCVLCNRSCLEESEFDSVENTHRTPAESLSSGRNHR
jgi:hypothetical protein